MKKIVKSMLSALLLIASALGSIAAVSAMPSDTSAIYTTSDIIAFGECGADGDNLVWEMDSSGTLTISGTGEMRDFDGVRPPWQDEYRDRIYRIHIMDGVTSIGNHAFSQTWWLREIELPDSLAKIGECAFSSCQRFSSINIPSSVREIGYGAFLGCVGLTSVQIPSGVERIGSSAFSGCIGLLRIDIPASAIEIDTRCLCEGNGITDIHVDANNPNYSSRDGVLFNKNQTELLAYAKDKTEPDYKVPDGVEMIQQNAFQNCRYLTNVELPDGIITIEWSAFSGCVELLRMEIPNSMRSITNPFSGCDKLSEIVIDRARDIIEGDTEGAPNAKVVYLREMHTEVLTEMEYTGREITPAVTVSERRKDGTASRTLEENSEYTLTYLDNIDAGTARIVVRYVGEYTLLPNSVQAFTIAPKSCADLMIEPIPDQMCTGREITPNPTITDNNIL